MRTLDEIDQLKQTRFGQHQKSHGLKLLYWFAKDCLTVAQNNALQLRCYPVNGDFGFHPFENRYERNGEKLLPDVTFPYYELGNLSKPAASNLPLYVREHYRSNNKMSNKDRIIVGINKKLLKTLFVTEHIDRSNFDKHATYQISRRLIMIIRGLSLDDFLLRITSATETSRNQDTRVIIEGNDESTSMVGAPSRCSCTIL
ncbi:uncharacterized protein LOC113642541 [Tachysurus fulvidraco]|uniref:uncharacterized protein LOC113642541 n=1 Tax=Tachysurus fulvidraco TaxID=1234273 RepID=UPI000F4FBAA3|nr:uncharacterized protein LOC113642541 [Tachysurus fulvidraco]